MKTSCTILHYFNKIIVLVFHPNWGPYTWNFHWNENVIWYSMFKSLVWCSVRTACTISLISAIYPYLELRYFFNFFFFLNLITFQYLFLPYSKIDKEKFIFKGNTIKSSVMLFILNLLGECKSQNLQLSGCKFCI